MKHLRSIRGRITLVATMMVAVTLLVASWLLLAWVEADLLDSARAALDEALETQAEQFGFSEEFLEPQMFEGFVDGRNVFIGLFTEESEGLAIGEMFIDDQPVANLLINVETGDIEEIYDIGFDAPLTDPELVEQIEALAFDVFELGDTDQFLVGAASLDEIANSVAAVRSALLVLGPGLVLAFGLLTWWLVGRALRPVMSITSQVEAITSTSLDRRVPVPETDDELSDLATVMNRMLDRLQRGGERQRQFSADASHELRSPLSTVRAAAELLEASPPADRTKRLAADIVAESIRMDELIGDLLELSRLDESSVLPDRQEVDLADLLRSEVAVELESGVVTVESPAELNLRASPRQLRRVIRNLVDNAIRHAASRVAISIAEAGDGTILLAVDDDGAGVAEENEQLIFERFSRLDEARTRDVGGSGLGLSLVKAIAESHGGTAVVSESDLGGARFVVALAVSEQS